MVKQLLLIISISVITGCDTDKAQVEVTQYVDKVPTLNEIKMATSPLKKVDNRFFQRHLRHGIYLRSISRQQYPLESLSADSHSRTDVNYSTTLFQEEGVEEGDRIKYDGERLFIATNPYYSEESTTNSSPQIRVFTRNSQGDITPEANVSLKLKDATVDSIYLHDNHLAAFANSLHYSIYTTENLFAKESFFPVEQTFTLSLLNTSNLNNVQLTHRFTIDGRVIDSRQIGNKLYFVSSYSPYIPGLPYAETNDQQLENYRKVLSTPIEALLPKITNSQGISQSLVSTEQCYIPASAERSDGFDGLVTLTVIDITQPNDITSVCVNSDIQGLYASPNAIYLYGTTFSPESSSTHNDYVSVVHKFSIDNNQFNYQASKELPGSFGQNLTNLRFSEYQSMLRVITTQGDTQQGFEHTLFILEDLKKHNNELTIISQLPNDTTPKRIGKVNDNGIVQENIKAVRFVDNIAYVVTFLETDPLYVLNLTDPNAPYISGELEVPGYSSYLHPLSENLLLGIGQNIDPSRLENDTDIDKTPVIEGAKISLFDVSNINAPIEINSIIHANAYTPVEFNYHALTMLTHGEDNSFRFGIPIERWHVTSTTTENESIDIWAPENYLSLFEITGKDTNAQLNVIGSIYPSNNTNKPHHRYTSSWDDRAIFHQNDIYYLHGNSIWHSYWHDPKNTTGPF
ncbi:beta-propeller domain-containing protein [Thalassotalea sediminis]|uniref:beta-propeller domain-containing protein n=1 Tax=Thalassotalea sediminis TaxID=1759089 RepID=UPI0025741854|nr:beta-propeller domain-containing protein [Thalassotalea sediminis]